MSGGLGGPEKLGNDLKLEMDLENLERTWNLEKNTENPGILHELISCTPKLQKSKLKL